MQDSPDTPIHLEGQLLLADPSLHNGFFHKSVILLAEHSSDEGAYGLVLNQPTERTVGELLTSDEFEALHSIPVYLGGPVGQEHLTFTAFWTEDDDSLHFATRISAQDAIERTHQPGTLIRAFAGHSGWEPGQLEGELRKNSWITTRPSAKLLSNTHDPKLWAELLRDISPYHRILAEVPDDIFMN